VVYVSNRTGTPEIWLMDEGGGNQKRITETGRYHQTPAWSPDGKSIVFCANYDGSNIDVYTMRLDGTALERITDYIEMDSTPEYSPDGSRIIFHLAPFRERGSLDLRPADKRA
jgi:TolB protein